MKKKFITYINLCLGALSLLLAGCSIKKNLEHQPALLYGVPVEYYEQLRQQEMDSTKTLPADTIKEQPADSSNMRAPGIMVKYGIPAPR